MSMGGGGSRDKIQSDINVTPLVDVCLVLLIIFMLTAHVMEFGLEINVPSVNRVKDTTKELPVVSLTSTQRRLAPSDPMAPPMVSEPV